MTKEAGASTLIACGGKCSGSTLGEPKAEFFDFEVGGHDGAYKGRVHVIVPFVGRKNGKVMKIFVLCVVTNTPPQFVGSAMRGIAPSVLTLTTVGMKLCMLHRNFALSLYICDLPML